MGYGLLEKLRLSRPIIRVAAVCIVIAGFALFAGLPQMLIATNVNVVRNSDFESGFVSQPGCGMVPHFWTCYHNGGAAVYGFYDEQWDPVVYQGTHSLRLDMNTNGILNADNDRYQGIYQTVPVARGSEYTFNLAGLIRTTQLEGDPWRYRVQFGWSEGQHADWNRVSNWQDMGWNNYYDYDNHQNPGSFSGYTTRFTPTSDHVTVYIRVWKKWGMANQSLAVYLDGISLTGPQPDAQPRGQDGGQDGSQSGVTSDGSPVQPAPVQPAPSQPVAQPTAPTPSQPAPSQPASSQPAPSQPAPSQPAPSQPAPQPTAPPSQPAPSQPAPTTRTEIREETLCDGPNLITNGSFEASYIPISIGHVAESWGAFTTGPGSNVSPGGNYRLDFENNPNYVGDGNFGQLISIDTKGIASPLPNRLAGVYQDVTGLQIGTIYELTIQGLVRGDGNTSDPQRFTAEWGYNLNADQDLRNVNNWQTVNVGAIYPLNATGPANRYTTRFQPQANQLVWFIRAWKRSAGVNETMILNIDGISLSACRVHRYAVSVPVSQPASQPVSQPASQPASQSAGTGGPVTAACTYIVQSGDTLGKIAARYGTSVNAIVQANSIDNPNVIHVGQKFQLPGNQCQAQQPAAPPTAVPTQVPTAVPTQVPTQVPTAVPTQAPTAVPTQAPAQPIPVPPTPTPAPTPAPISEPAASSARTHTVQSGDSLSAIALKYGTDLYTLIELNNIADPNLIYVGQVLKVSQ